MLVRWIDSSGQDGWGGYQKPSLQCETVGHLYAQDEEAVVIAQSRCATVFGNYITIPMLAVTSIVPLAPVPVATCVRKRRSTGS